MANIFFSSRSFDPSLANRELAAAAADGLGVARAAPLWEFTEPQPPSGGTHHYDWRFDDFMAGRLAAYGFRWIAVLAFAAGWASIEPHALHSPPRAAADYAAYAAATAARYRGRIVAYEIWNEENLSAFWPPAPDAVSYARLYLAARAAIHRADPGVPVLIGGIGGLASGNGTAYLAQLFQQPGLKGQVDGVAVHPYGRDPAEVVARVRGYREELRLLGAGGVPLYVTEYGWSASPPSALTYAPPALRGAYLGAVAQELLRSDCNVRSAIFYAWTTPEQNPASVDDWYGVAGRDAGSTPTTTAVAATARTLVRSSAVPLRLCGPDLPPAAR